MGEDFVKKIRPAGCVLFIALAILVSAVCLTAGRDPIKGYEPPQTDEYFAQHPEELLTELEENVFPHLQGFRGADVQSGLVVVQLHTDSFAVDRAALLRYYAQELFELVRVE